MDPQDMELTRGGLVVLATSISQPTNGSVVEFSVTYLRCGVSAEVRFTNNHQVLDIFLP